MAAVRCVYWNVTKAECLEIYRCSWFMREREGKYKQKCDKEKVLLILETIVSGPRVKKFFPAS